MISSGRREQQPALCVTHYGYRCGFHVQAGYIEASFEERSGVPAYFDSPCVERGALFSLQGLYVQAVEVQRPEGAEPISFGLDRTLEFLFEGGSNPMAVEGGGRGVEIGA